MSSIDLVARRISDRLLETGQSPEQFAEELQANGINLSGRTIRRILEVHEERRDTRLHQDTRTKLGRAFGLDKDWAGAPIRRKAAA